MKLFHTGLSKIEECQKHLDLLSVPLLIDVNSCESRAKILSKNHVHHLFNKHAERQISNIWNAYIENQQVLPPK